MRIELGHPATTRIGNKTDGDSGKPAPQRRHRRFLGHPAKQFTRRRTAGLSLLPNRNDSRSMLPDGRRKRKKPPRWGVPGPEPDPGIRLSVVVNP